MQIANKIILPELSYKISGILFTAHNELGRFCNEKQYADFVENLLLKNNFTFDREKILPESFAGEHKGRNKVDFIVENKVLVEIKAKRLITREDYYQTRRYLSSLGLKLGLLVNFRDKYLKPKRILNSAIRNS